MAYTKTNWEDLPSTDTPITSANLQNMEDGIEEAHNLIDEIKDAEIYSTNEVKTNKVWFDRKPIYRKVYNINLANNATSTTVATNLTNIDTLYINSGNSFVTYNSMSIVQLGFYASSTDFSRAYISWDKQTLGITLGSAYSSGAKIITVVLEYTKTTD